MSETTTNRRDLMTLLLAALAGLTVGGAAAAVAPVEDDDVDLDDDPEVGSFNGRLIGSGHDPAIDGDRLGREVYLAVRFHRYASGLGILEVVPSWLRHDETQWRSFPLDPLASASLWDSMYTQQDWR